MNKDPFRKTVYGKNASRKKSIVVFLLVAVLLVSMVGMASAVSQNWYLKTNDPEVSGANYEMHKASGYGPAGSVAVASGVSKIWSADEASAVDVSFGIGEWTGNFDFTNGPNGYLNAGETITLAIGYLDADGDFHSAATQVAEGGKSSIWPVSMTPSSDFTVPAGNYLALKVSITGDVDGVYIDTHENYEGVSASHVTSPPESDPYPVPEFSTLVLLSAGLLALAGFVVYSRRRNNKPK